MKKILGLDLGTNSIGWAVVSAEEADRENETSFLKPIGIDAARRSHKESRYKGCFDCKSTKNLRAIHNWILRCCSARIVVSTAKVQKI